MSETTRHGDNIANQIQGEDAYGEYGLLTIADIWSILDQLQTSYMEQSAGDPERMINRIGDWMHELEAIDDDLPL